MHIACSKGVPLEEGGLCAAAFQANKMSQCGYSGYVNTIIAMRIEACSRGDCQPREVKPAECVCEYLGAPTESLRVAVA